MCTLTQCTSFFSVAMKKQKIEMIFGPCSCGVAALRHSAATHDAASQIMLCPAEFPETLGDFDAG